MIRLGHFYRLNCFVSSFLGESSSNCALGAIGVEGVVSFVLVEATLIVDPGIILCFMI
jgi:hypothetical protein